MQKFGKQFAPFSFYLVSSLFLFFFLQHSYFFGTVGVLQTIFSPIDRGIYLLMGREYHPFDDRIHQLEEKNAQLISELAVKKSDVNEMKALRDQFSETSHDPKTLLPVKIIGMRRFVPGVSVPDELTINAGLKNGVKQGMTVIYKNMVVGKVSLVSSRISIVDLPSKQSYFFTGKTVKTNALGVIQGTKDGTYILGNVVLSDTLTIGDSVVTNGDIDSTGKGFPPDLVIGEITSVSKIPSALFQAAEVKNTLDVTTISDVFVMLSY